MIYSVALFQLIVRVKKQLAVVFFSILIELDYIIYVTVTTLLALFQCYTLAAFIGHPILQLH